MMTIILQNDIKIEKTKEKLEDNKNGLINMKLMKNIINMLQLIINTKKI